MRKITIASACLCALSAAHIVSADTIVQSGILSGGLGTENHQVILNQFDTQGGLLQLNFVQIDFLTSVIGGYETDGSGTPVHIHVELSTAWSLNGNPLSNLQAMVDTIVPNTSPGAATVFNTDTDQVVFDQAATLSPWIGAGQITLDAVTFFDVYEDPAKIINFGAGGSARYTVTYDYSAVPAPGGLAAIVGSLMINRARRRAN